MKSRRPPGRFLTNFADRVSRRHEAQLRSWYAGGRGNKIAKAYARVWSKVFALGVFSERWVTLEVPGRKTGNLTEFPLGMAEINDRHYLVSMLGECNWTKNVRAAEGRATLKGRKQNRGVYLSEVSVAERPTIIKRYLEQVPGARPHIRVDHTAPVSEFDQVADEVPVFEVLPGKPGLSRSAKRV